MQTIDLTTPFVLQNGTKIDISQPDFRDDTSECKYVLYLRTSNAANAQICQWDMIIRNGQSIRADRQVSPAVGLVINDLDRYIVLSFRDTPTGYTDAINAWKAGNAGSSRQSAFKSHLLSAGHIGPSLTGT
jgi:hypothetical protein